MSLILYIFITILITIECQQFLEPLRNTDTLPQLRHNVKGSADNKKVSSIPVETKLFDHIQEHEYTEDTTQKLVPRSNQQQQQQLFREIKCLLQKLQEKLNEIDANKKCLRRKFVGSTKSIEHREGTV